MARWALPQLGKRFSLRPLDEDEQRLADVVRLEAQVLAVLDMGEAVAQLLVIGADHQPVHAGRAVQSGEAGVEAAAGEAGGEHARFGGEAGVERLGHGSELRHEARRHAGGERDGMSGLPRVEPQQPRAGGGGADRADGGGGVPAAVAMHRVHPLADPAEDLQAGDIGVEAGPAGGAFLLGQREDGGDEDGAGMGLGGIEIVVEVERVGGGAVDQGRPGRGEAGAHADRGGGARRPSLGPSRRPCAVTGSAAPGMATAIVSMKARWAASQAASGQSAGVSASQAP